MPSALFEADSLNERDGAPIGLGNGIYILFNSHTVVFYKVLLHEAVFLIILAHAAIDHFFNNVLWLSGVFGSCCA